jgi:P4 family phage/plasmid primase-like protien
MGPPEDAERRPVARGAAPENDPSKITTQSLTRSDGKRAGGTFLFDYHRRELEVESSIDPEVIAERGYQTVTRPTNGDQRERERLKALQIPSWAISEDYYFPGLLIPIWGPNGARVSYQWKPRIPASGKNGKKVKYPSPRGQASRLDVHPRHASLIVDPTIEVWLTEGVKKADSLTSRGICTIALNGVFGWRGQLGTLGDWEDVPLRGRVVTICYDSDARTNPNVLRAMRRLGSWLRSKGVERVYYLIPPGGVNDKPTKGVDDFFAAGGTLAELKAARTTTPPPVHSTDDKFTDARLAEVFADDVLADHYIWVHGVGWLRWDGLRWAQSDDVAVVETVRQYVLDQFIEAVTALRDGTGDATSVDGLRQLLGAGRMRSVLSLSRGIVQRQADELDADPDLLNTPGGVVDLRTGEVLMYDPTLLITKITKGRYRPKFRHPDWDKALEALPKPEREWLQVRTGQGITGHPTPDGVLPVLQGSGENGKSALTTDGLVPALGDYASMASPKLLQAFKGSSSEHSTERAELRGKRLLVAEELTEGRSIDITTLKQIQDVTTITARFIRQDNFTFRASHSLFATTNYVPIVNETDHGAWRRLALLRFLFTFRKPGDPLHTKTDRRGDPTLKARIRDNTDNQHDAIVTWVIEGALRYHANPETSLQPTAKVRADTKEWRKTADRILSIWDEKLIANRDSCIIGPELLEAFNTWLRANGHNEWSKELFGPRFLQHDESVRHGVEYKQTRHPQNVSRLPGSWPRDIPARPWVYQGVRFRTESDPFDDEEER